MSSTALHYKLSLCVMSGGRQDHAFQIVCLLDATKHCQPDLQQVHQTGSSMTMRLEGCICVGLMKQFFCLSSIRGKFSTFTLTKTVCS